MDEKTCNKIVINSNNGWSEIEICVDESRDTLFANITGTGKFWKRQESVDGTAELVEDFHVNFLQAPLLRDNLALLKESLELWLQEPGEINILLSSTDYPKVSIFIGELEGFICSVSKPVFVLHYEDARIETKLKFVTDQSCLNLMLNDLRKYLAPS